MIPKMKNHMKVEFLLEIENYSAKKKNPSSRVFLQIIFFFFGLNSTFSHADETPKHRLQLRENCSKISLMAFKESHRKTESRLSAFEKLSIASSTRCNFRFALCNDRPSFLVLFQLHTVLNLNNCPKTRYWKYPIAKTSKVSKLIFSQENSHEFMS